MLKKIANSESSKKYIIALWVLVAILSTFSLFYPISLKVKAAELLGDKAISMASSISSTLSQLNGKDLTNIRSNPTANSDSYKKINKVLENLSKELNCNKIFSVYKGVGGKYYYLLDSQNTITVPGAEIDQIYLSHKNVLDKISDGKIVSQSPSSTVNTPSGKAIIAWHNLTNDKGEIVGVLGVECCVKNPSFNKLGFVKLNLWALFSVSSLILAIFATITAIKVAKHSHNKKITKADFAQMPTLSQLENEILQKNKDDAKNQESTEPTDENSAPQA
ncbi:MAG: hypothetical protein RR806_02080 [Oscillospiraceae bacterium]